VREGARRYRDDSNAILKSGGGKEDQRIAAAGGLSRADVHEAIKRV